MSGHQYTQELLQGNNLQCTELIRMSRDSFVRLCNHFKEKNWLRDSKHISVEEKMFIFLMIIGHNERFSVMKRRFQHSKETIHNCFHEVLDKMLVFSEEVIRPTTFNPNPNIPGNNRRERRMFKGVVGALDGTLIHAYKARGRDCYQNVLAICDLTIPCDIHVNEDVHDDNDGDVEVVQPIGSEADQQYMVNLQDDIATQIMQARS
ncbi:hypothetical protein Tco_0529698 [Tanacetum coccineum]